MNYTVLIKPSAERALDRLPHNVRTRVLAALEELQADPRPRGATMLQGEDNLWRIRVGQYRIVYAIQDDQLLVLVVRIAHRKDVYRGR